ncbi:hypothetical protein ACKKBF_B36150 [Auxenochlorella protothecoides x Auxenochlorella symbiontica]
MSAWAPAVLATPGVSSGTPAHAFTSRTQSLRQFRGTHYLSVRRNVQAECSMSTEGPGTGRRHTPVQLGQEHDTTSHDQQAHAGKTTEECYREFPFQVRMSTPLFIKDREPAGKTVQEAETEAPASGHRRRPSMVPAAEVADNVVPVPPRTMDTFRRSLAERRNIVLGDWKPMHG